MKQLLLTFCTLGILVTAQAQELVNRTSATGREQTIDLTASTCSDQSNFPMFGEVTSINVSSRFEYVACVEYITQEFEVTGKSWNKKETRTGKPGIANWSLVRKSGGDSQYMSGHYDSETGKTQSITYWDFLRVKQSVDRVCEAERKAALATATRLENTQCAGQRP